ncbi:aminotransferase class IV [Microbulbifer sp. TRSA007]|uniref:aminotransferase class IV n=1 Tax=Microbulbifer sp. TRSA007 TaxID=3243384 RepID=UPI0040391FF7
MYQLPQMYFRGLAVDQLPDDADYSGGILETMRCHNKGLPLWSFHRARLERSGVLDEACLGEIEQSTLKLTAGCRWPEAIARLRVGSVRGQQCWDLVLRPLIETAEGQVGTSLFPCSTSLPIGSNSNQGCKTLLRNRYNAAKAELPVGQFLDGLMLDSAGRVIETLRCNILARFGGKWMTPSLHRCGVHGVMRQWLSSHIHWQEEDMGLSELCEADELALCNSVRGVLPVVEVIGYKNWPVGVETRKLQKLILDKLW